MSFLVLRLSLRKKEVVVFVLLYFGCIVIENVLQIFLVVPWVGLQCVIVVYPDHTHFGFYQ